MTRQLSAWWFLVGLSCRRLGWSLQTAAALALVLLLAGLVALVGFANAQLGRGAWNVALFSQVIVVGVYLSVLLPLICLCFGTQALGGEWEERNLVWLLTRPVPRPAAYLAKYVAAVPWALGLAVGGLFLAGLAAGPRHHSRPAAAALTAASILGGAEAAGPLTLAALRATDGPPEVEVTWPGLAAAEAFWPVAALGALAYLALFQLLGASFRRSTVIAVGYAFVLESMVGAMPGLFKRASLAFYNKCLAFAVAAGRTWDTADGSLGVVPDRVTLFLPVDGATAVAVLMGATLGLLALGTWRFARREYADLT